MVNHEYFDLTMKEMISLLKHIKWCRLGVAENNQPYIVPMYYCFEPKGNYLCFTLYSPVTGHKMHCMESNQKVCLEFELQRDNYFFSIVVIGEVTICPPVNGNSLLQISSSEVTGRCYVL